MARITRRDWLKFLGLTAAGGMLPACRAPKEVIVTVPPEVVTVPAAAEVVEIIGWTHWGGSDLERAQNAIMVPFNEGPGKDLGIHFEFLTHIATGAEPEWVATYVAAYQANQAPDLIHMSGGLLPQFQPLGMLLEPPADVQAFIREHYVPGAVDYATVEGNTYGYPTELQAQFQMVNGLHLQDAGLPGAPQSWQDFRDYARALTIRDETGALTRAGFAVPDAYAEENFLLRHVMHAAEGEDFIDVENLTCNANSDIGRAIMELWYNMAIVDQSTQAGVWTIWDGGFNNEFWSMMWFDIWAANFLVYVGPDGPTGMTGPEYLENMVLDMLPTRSGAGQLTEARIYLWVVVDQTEHPDECWTYLKWLNEGPDYRMMKFFVDTFMFPPAIKGMSFSDKFTPAQVETQINAFENSIAMPFVKGLFEMYEAVMAEQAAVWFGEKGWEEAEADLKAAIDSILETQYGG